MKIHYGDPGDEITYDEEEIEVASAKRAQYERPPWRQPASETEPVECGKCGGSVWPDANFCSHCGQTLTSGDQRSFKGNFETK